MKTKQRISIVIPVYNEEESLAACLQAIAGQTLQPYEVIVVDNNSTDNTAAVAAGFPFVRLLHEPKQGVVHARNRGFDSARGAIIGRIDADTLLPADWVANLQSVFADPSVDAVSGSLHYYDIAASRAVDGVDTYMRGWMARRMRSHTFLLGANMGLRRSAWRAVRTRVCATGEMHEDLDLALHLAELGGNVVYEPHLVAGVSARRIDMDLRSLSAYIFLSPRTYARHRVPERRYMYPLIAIVFLNYPQLRLLFRGYDQERGRFTWSRLLTSPAVTRVNPALYVTGD